MTQTTANSADPQLATLQKIASSLDQIAIALKSLAAQTLATQISEARILKTQILAIERNPEGFSPGW